MSRMIEQVGQVMNISEDNHYGFFDWFCKTDSLQRRAKRLVPKLVKVIEANRVGNRFDESEVRVIFKNNCPIDGDLYDDFRIVEQSDRGKVLFTVTPKVGYNSMNGESEVWGHTNGFGEALISSSSFDDIVNYFRGDESHVPSF